MRYFGGKFKIAKQIAGFINEQIKPGQPYVEPFCGACWVVSKISPDRIRMANDFHTDLIMMWKEIQAGWVPPAEVSNEQYDKLKTAPSSALRGIVGFGCSHSGKWFGGYARGNTSQRYAENARNSNLKKMKTMTDVVFSQGSYEAVDYPPDSLIYCDPPYASTTGYSTGDFDHIKFWEWIREMTRKGHNVLVSEYVAPPDFETVLEIPTKTHMKDIDGTRIPRIEKLFRYPL